MKQLRFKLVVASSPAFVSWAVPRANYMIKHKEKYPIEKRWKMVCTIVNHMRMRARCKTNVYGVENLPMDEGYIMYSNHQGKYDALGIFLAMPQNCSVLWEEKSADRLLARQVCGLVEGKTISFTDPRQQIRVLNEIAEDVKAGKRYLIFPEGGYKDNHNDLQEFKSGCFMSAIKAKKPVIPVAIYDSWRAMDTNTFEKVTTEVHFLKPITYEEYASLNKHTLCALVKERIEEKMDELKKSHSTLTLHSEDDDGMTYLRGKV
jgi:1-acyl-sn-glycerol-3-phosphate acyltransferase